MRDFLNKLREAGYLRPENPDRPKRDDWRNYPAESHWKDSPAIQSKNTAKTVKNAQPKPKAVKPVICTCEGCKSRVYKLSLCKPHWLIVMQERNRKYRAKRWEKERREKERAAMAKSSNGERLCKKCGKPAQTWNHILLCREHYLEYQKVYADKREAEANALKEATMKRNQEILAEVWGKKKSRYKEE